jgi:hypothetical protein
LFRFFDVVNVVDSCEQGFVKYFSDLINIFGEGLLGTFLYGENGIRGANTQARRDLSRLSCVGFLLA